MWSEPDVPRQVRLTEVLVSDVVDAGDRVEAQAVLRRLVHDRTVPGGEAIAMTHVDDDRSALEGGLDLRPRGVRRVDGRHGGAGRPGRPGRLRSRRPGSRRGPARRTDDDHDAGDRGAGLRGDHRGRGEDEGEGDRSDQQDSERQPNGATGRVRLSPNGAAATTPVEPDGRDHGPRSSVVLPTLAANSDATPGGALSRSLRGSRHGRGPIGIGPSMMCQTPIIPSGDM